MEKIILVMLAVIAVLGVGCGSAAGPAAGSTTPTAVLPPAGK